MEIVSEASVSSALSQQEMQAIHGQTFSLQNNNGEIYLEFTPIILLTKGHLY